MVGLRSLKARVTLAALVIFALSIWSLYFYATWVLREDVTHLLSEQQRAALSMLAPSMNNEFAERMTALRNVAAALASKMAKPADVQRELDDRSVLPTLFNSGVVAIDAHGICIADLPRKTGRVGMDYRGDYWIDDALNEGKPIVGRPTMGRKLHVPLFVISTPIKNSADAVIGVVAGVISLGKPNFLDEVADSHYGGHGEFMLVDPVSRRIIIASDRHRIMAPLPATGAIPAVDRHLSGNGATSIFTNSQGQEQIVSSKVIPLSGWLIVAALPTRVAFRPIARVRQRMLLAAIVLTLLAGALIWWILRRQFFPITSAVRALTASSRSDLPIQPIPVIRSDEVGELVSAFNRLLHMLSLREEALKKSEARYATLIEWSPEPLAVNRGGRLIYANPAAVALLGAGSAAEILGRPVLDFVHPEFHQLVCGRLKSVSQDRTAAPPIAEKFVRLDGTIVDVEVQTIRIEYDGEPAIQVAVRDVTERDRAVEALRRESHRNEMFLRNASDGVHILDADGKVLEVSNSFCEMLGYTRQQLLDAHVSLWDAQLSDEELRQVLAQQIAHNGPMTFETRHRRSDGRIIEVEVTGNALVLDGKLAIFNSARDISERVRVQAELRTLSRAIEQSPASILIVDRKGAIEYVNPRFEQVSGYSLAECIGNSVHMLKCDKTPQEVYAQLWTAAREGGEWRGELNSRRKSGELYSEFVVISPIKNANGEIEHYVAVKEDISERQRLFEMHMQAQKLESLGTLAGGIAHDFNNILAAVYGNADLAMEDVGAEHVAAESLEEIRKASERASELVRRIMAFARPSRTGRKVVDLGAVTKEVLGLLRSTLPAGIELRTRFAKDAPRAFADPAQVHEAVVNLTTNAAHAIGPRAGLIEYALEGVEVDAGLAYLVSGLKPGSYARLSVTDSGSGIDQATIRRIFDAFYTTKPVGEGTGLGLSMVHGIMKSHEGAVAVESTPGKGSCFSLYFPAAEAAHVEADDVSSTETRRSGARRVLYVDDESALVHLANRALSRRGHDVSGFTDPVHALERFRADPTAFDVVFTDMSMPRMSGVELTQQLHAIRADIPVLMMSGQLGQSQEDAAREAGANDLIRKPASMEELAQAIDRL